MKTFEEQFPSLEDSELTTIGYGFDETERDDRLFILREDVQKHCLDIHKVKEAIEKVFNKEIENNTTVSNYIDKLTIELGLGE